MHYYNRPSNQGGPFYYFDLETMKFKTMGRDASNMWTMAGTRYIRRADKKAAKTVHKIKEGPFKVRIETEDGEVLYYISEIGFLSDWTASITCGQETVYADDMVYRL